MAARSHRSRVGSFDLWIEEALESGDDVAGAAGTLEGPCERPHEVERGNQVVVGCPVERGDEVVVVGLGECDDVVGGAGHRHPGQPPIPPVDVCVPKEGELVGVLGAGDGEGADGFQHPVADLGPVVLGDDQALVDQSRHQVEHLHRIEVSGGCDDVLGGVELEAAGEHAEAS